MKTLIVVVLDKSGSMATTTAQTITGYNKFLEEQKALPDAADLVQVLFDTTVQIGPVHPVAMSPELTAMNYNPSGSTALYDAVGKAIARADLVDNIDRYIVLVLTDGMENASRDYNEADIRKLVGERTDKGNWTFVYIGADVDQWGIESQKMAFATYNSVGTQNIDMAQIFSNASKGLSAYRNSIRGQTMTFYNDACLTSDDWLKPKDSTEK